MTCKAKPKRLPFTANRKPFGTTDRTEHASQIREARRQAKALNALLGAVA